MKYPTIEDAVGNTPLVALQRMGVADNAARGNVILGKLEGKGESEGEAGGGVVALSSARRRGCVAVPRFAEVIP